MLASEKTKALRVNAHGALILLRKAVRTKDILKLRNTLSCDEVACRVVYVGPSEELGMMNVGVKFDEPAPQFWHIALPPADWNVAALNR